MGYMSIDLRNCCCVDNVTELIWRDAALEFVQRKKDASVG
jgi:hypothetical protein